MQDFCPAWHAKVSQGVSMPVMTLPCFKCVASLACSVRKMHTEWTVKQCTWQVQETQRPIRSTCIQLPHICYVQPCIQCWGSHAHSNKGVTAVRAVNRRHGTAYMRADLHMSWIQLNSLTNAFLAVLEHNLHFTCRRHKSRCGCPAIRFHNKVIVCGSHRPQISALASH